MKRVCPIVSKTKPGQLVGINPKFFMRVMPIIEALRTDRRNGVPVRKLDLEILLKQDGGICKMKTSKEHLLAEKETAAWWSGVTRNPLFERVILMASADIIQMQHPDKIDGATRILETLSTMADNPPEPYKAPSSGINFDLNPKK